jgi:hypothetical protein
MSSRDEDFLRLYRTHRFDDQYAWYEARVDEYESALRTDDEALPRRQGGARRPPQPSTLALLGTAP